MEHDMCVYSGLTTSENESKSDENIKYGEFLQLTNKLKSVDK